MNHPVSLARRSETKRKQAPQNETNVRSPKMQSLLLIAHDTQQRLGMPSRTSNANIYGASYGTSNTLWLFKYSLQGVTFATRSTTGNVPCTDRCTPSENS